MIEKHNVAVIGGTGNLGAAIAARLAKAGHDVVIGSRSAESASARADELGHGLRGASNSEAAMQAEVVVVTVPFGAHAATLREIAAHCAGKIVIDTTVPLVPPKVAKVQMPAEGSAAQIAQNLLPDANVVSAFHNVAAHKLAEDHPVDCDVLVFGDSKEARGVAIKLAEAMGLRGIHAGSLANSVAAEALTSVLIFINKNYAADGAGIQITKIPSAVGQRN